MKLKKDLLGLAIALLPLSIASAQDLGEIGPSPYEFITDSWMQPFADEGFTWGGNSSVLVESEDRIFVVQRGETELPSPLPAEYTTFAGSMGWNVLRGRGRVWQNCIYVIDSDGNVLEVWNHWDHLFMGTEGAGPHKIRMSPYDPERRLWLVDESGHIIYVLSNDGTQLLMTLGEKNVSGNDETHFSQPQDVAFLPDGKILIADGLGNKRIVVRDSQGKYLSEFGEAGTAPHQFQSVHSMALGPDEKLYVVDRDARDIKVFRQTAPRDSASYPAFVYDSTWPGLGMALDITVTEDAAWVTDLNPPKLIKFNLDGSRDYTFLLPTEGTDMWIEMHSLSVDDDGNLYGTDNQAGRPQKLVPKPDADPSHIVGKPYIPQ
jgi:DNA-binding beta-propeller fold protein YncE